jgi:DNA polymerase-3 subunit delta
MVAIKPTELPSLLKSPAKRAEAFLVHGPDAGQVAELAKTIATQLCAASSPPGEILRLSDQDLAQTPGRLATEARSLPMFGGRPVIIVKQAPQLTPAIFEDLLDGPPLAGFVIVEAGNLKRDAKIRQLFENAKNAAAIACYGADERGLQQLIRDDVKAAGMTITAEAAERLAGLLGGDWAVSRSEIAKLTLFAADADRGEITMEHVDAIVGDSSAHAFEAAIAAALTGNAAVALNQIDGLAAAGTPASVILNVLLRHLQSLHTVAAAIQRGEAFDTAVGHLRPPPHFKAKDALRAQAARWRANAVAAAIGETHEAVRQTRLKPALEQEITSELLMRLASEGQKGQKAKAGTARFQR